MISFPSSDILSLFTSSIWVGVTTVRHAIIFIYNAIYFLWLRLKFSHNSATPTSRYNPKRNLSVNFQESMLRALGKPFAAKTKREKPLLSCLTSNLRLPFLLPFLRLRLKGPMSLIVSHRRSRNGWKWFWKMLTTVRRSLKMQERTMMWTSKNWSNKTGRSSSKTNWQRTKLREGRLNQRVKLWRTKTRIAYIRKELRSTGTRPLKISLYRSGRKCWRWDRRPSRGPTKRQRPSRWKKRTIRIIVVVSPSSTFLRATLDLNTQPRIGNHKNQPLLLKSLMESRSHNSSITSTTFCRIHSRLERRVSPASPISIASSSYRKRSSRSTIS